MIRHPWLSTPLYGRPVRTLLFLIKTLRTSNLPPEYHCAASPYTIPLAPAQHILGRRDEIWGRQSGNGGGKADIYEGFCVAFNRCPNKRSRSDRLFERCSMPFIEHLEFLSLRLAHVCSDIYLIPLKSPRLICFPTAIAALAFFHLSPTFQKRNHIFHNF